ncbi:zinc-binding dehydrogenase [Alpinimonas psychrophila]|uniref:Threonine dehydrogenase-like Zn-dependent dehydrogenase n=1 Tax=Alpinimonas psychrophila TaxID=748908 RepID=A0A7W3PPD0_9MICO|nr:alcohol dehydrogenase catalytic domain-containing protein [Alpinimonas psychrophila]MBA8829367.1 threonine dehydrogenase-like Zn-dependent dehydrogenase [Alpinimonas psychrophila]
MRATMIYGAGDVRVEDVSYPVLMHATDAIVRIVRACVCGSDLHGYGNRPADAPGKAMGHESIGIVEEIGSDVHKINVGDFVIVPFAYSDGTCEFCVEGLQTSCRHGGYWGNGDVGGGQAEAVRSPFADGTLVPVPGTVDPALYPSLLALTDVYGTGFHAAFKARVNSATTVTVIGDGAVGLMAVLSAKRLGAQRIILMGRHTVRTDLGVLFGATDVVAERGAEGIARVLELTKDDGTHTVLEAVGYREAYDMAVGVVRAGGVISRVGVPQYEEAPIGSRSLFSRNITLTGGPAPVRAYIEQLLPDVLSGKVNPGLVFDKTVSLENVAEGYAAMAERTALKVIVAP